jgi:hypothetical protein
MTAKTAARIAAIKAKLRDVDEWLQGTLPLGLMAEFQR